MIKMMKTWKAATVRYGTGIIQRTKENLGRRDRKSRNVLTLHRGLHARSRVDRVRPKRNGGGGGAARVTYFVEDEIFLLRFVWGTTKNAYSLRTVGYTPRTKW